MSRFRVATSEGANYIECDAPHSEYYSVWMAFPRHMGYVVHGFLVKMIFA
jgi:hypothetical protein